jgi:hypothetical protein
MLLSRRILCLAAVVIILGVLFSACVPTPEELPTPSATPTRALPTRTPTITPSPTEAPPEWGDVVTWAASDDTVAVVAGSPPEQAQRTGNGEQLGGGASSVDYYMMFRVDDGFLYDGSPTTHVRVEIEYLDEGTDQFRIDYDAVAGGPNGDGRWMPTALFRKTDSGEFRVATFYLRDALFANRLQESDFRIADWGDGAETIRRVTVTRIMPGEERVIAESLLASELESAQWAFGPRSGRLYHNPSDEFLVHRLAFVGLRNFITESRFVNPYSATFNSWDFGVGFRFESWNIFYMLVINSDRDWFLALREGGEVVEIASGTVVDLLTAEGESNILQLMVIGNAGYFYINGSYVDQFDLQQMISVGGGGVFVGTGFLIGNEVGGYYSDYEDFMVWSLPD